MCRGCEEFHQAMNEGLHDEVLPSADRTKEGRDKWLQLYAMAFASHGGGDPMFAIMLVTYAASQGLGPEEVYPVLYQMAALHKQAFIDTNQPNMKIESMGAYMGALSETYYVNTGSKIEDAINGVQTALVFDEMVLHNAPFVSEEKANMN